MQVTTKHPASWKFTLLDGKGPLGRNVAVVVFVFASPSSNVLNSAFPKHCPYFFLGVSRNDLAVLPAPTGQLPGWTGDIAALLREEFRVGSWAASPVSPANGLLLWNQTPKPLPKILPDDVDGRSRFHAWLNIRSIRFNQDIIHAFAVVSFDNQLYYLPSGRLCYFPSAWSRFSLEKAPFLAVLQQKEALTSLRDARLTTMQERPNLDPATIKAILWRAEKHLPRDSPILDIRHADLCKTFERSGLNGQQFHAMMDEGRDSDAFMTQLGWPDHANMRNALRFAMNELNSEQQALKRKRAEAEAVDTADEQEEEGEHEQGYEQAPAADQSHGTLWGCPRLSSWQDKETLFLKVMPEEFKLCLAPRESESASKPSDSLKNALIEACKLSGLSEKELRACKLGGRTCHQIISSAANDLRVPFELYWQVNKRAVRFAPATASKTEDIICRLAYNGKEFRAMRPPESN
jgi:hypothetical protein